MWYRILNSFIALDPLREQLSDTRRVALVIVFLTNMLDNLLLTSVVPIIPAFLLNLDKEEYLSFSNNTSGKHLPMLSPHEMQVLLTMNEDKEIVKWHKFHDPWANTSNYNLTHTHLPKFPFSAAAFSENSRVGWLLSSKAIVQLLANFLVGPLCNKFGYPILLFSGTLILLISTVVFAVAESYVPLFIARAIQGLGSAAAVISGAQWFVMGLTARKETYTDITPVHVLLKDKYILIATGVIWLTTMSMSVLEPTVPLWVMSFMKVKNWELGLIFLPDSIGYFIGTNCFGVVSQSIGRWSCCIFCMMLIALCQICLPFATSLTQLILPHFGLGLGLGITDAAIMPLLALLVDVKNESFYGCVYAVAQTAVCLAYSVGPFAAGMVVKEVGFPWLMRGMAVLNIVYCPLCYVLSKAPVSLDEEKPFNKCDQRTKAYTQDNNEVDEACFTYGHLMEEED
ncbi:hypothetical protein Btru_034645 [Bulinus truncatus]|nr:hypothetical protein Btru_034645 [Bulinus truncatus]